MPITLYIAFQVKALVVQLSNILNVSFCQLVGVPLGSAIVAASANAVTVYISLLSHTGVIVEALAVVHVLVVILLFVNVCVAVNHTTCSVMSAASYTALVISQPAQALSSKYFLLTISSSLAATAVDLTIPLPTSKLSLSIAGLIVKSSSSLTQILGSDALGEATLISRLAHNLLVIASLSSVVIVSDSANISPISQK